MGGLLRAAGIVGISLAILFTLTSIPAAALAFLVDGRFATSVWLTSTLYLIPFTVLTGSPIFVAVRAAGGALLVSGAIGIAATGVAAYLFVPMAVQCDTSYSARARLQKQLSPEEFSTLRTPETLTSSSWPCPTYFEYRTGSRGVGVSAVADVIHGTKLFREDLP